MKNLIYIFIGMMGLVTALASCSKKDAFSSDYEKSFKAWESFKSSSNNSYKYIAVESPVAFTRSETTITVKDGQITARDYFFYEYKVTGNNVGRYDLSAEWHETSTNLGTHGSEGWSLFSLDDVYSRARNVWISADKNKYDVTFENNNNGMISVAGYSRKSCPDECFIGVKIKSITQ